jgi:AbrB family looped-hinge helix DNA binding protein
MMNMAEIATVTSKGQVTIPLAIRNILKIKPGSVVMFKIIEKGIVLLPCELKEKPAYSVEEWKKIEKLVAEKGKVYRSAHSAKKYLLSL